MKNKKWLWIGIAAAVALAALGIYHYNDRVYHETYIVIDGEAYRRDALSLDLSGDPLEDLEKLAELPGLQELNLLDTEITLEQYEAIQAALPDCLIHWSVPFQGGYLPNDTTRITTSTFAREDIDLLRYFPQLTEIQAAGCREYGLLMELESQRPDLTVSYTVPICGAEHSNQAATLTITDPVLTELTGSLSLLPRAEQVELTGQPLSVDQLLELTAAYPQISFRYEFDALGQRISWDAEFLDLSGTAMADTEELEAMLPLLPQLTKVDMVDCGFSNEEMAELNARHADVNFVWTVSVCGIKLRTDITYFMPVQYHIQGLTNCSNLKYCTEMRVMDFGHYGISNVDFVEYMPKLEYLLLHSAYISDLSAIGNCVSLRFLELMNTPVTDFWPLTNLVNLEDLNISCTPDRGDGDLGTFGDYTPLLQMTWLDRIWMAYSYPNREGRETIAQCMPNTITHYYSLYTVRNGWRHSLNYYTHRDILGMTYYT